MTDHDRRRPTDDDEQTIMAMLDAQIVRHLEVYGTEPKALVLDDEQRHRLWQETIRMSMWEAPAGLGPSGVRTFRGITILPAEHLRSVSAIFPIWHHTEGLSIRINGADVLFASAYQPLTTDQEDHDD